MSYTFPNFPLRINVILGVLFGVLLNVFLVMRIQPTTLSDISNQDPQRGRVHRTVGRVMEIAEQDAAKPYEQVKFRYIYLSRNPALFAAVAEWGARLGLTASDILVFSLLLVNGALWFQFLWVRQLFGSDAVAHLANLFLLCGPAVLFYGPTLHHLPYNLFGFNLAVWAFLRHCQAGGCRYLALACAGYLLCCHNYWMFYLSTAVVVFGVHRQETGRWWSRSLTIFAAMPILAVAGHLYRMGQALGGFGQGIGRLVDIAVARTIDARTADSHWFPDQKFVPEDIFWQWPGIWNSRVIDYYVAPATSYLSMLLITLWLVPVAVRRSYQPFWYLALGGFAWYSMFVQHSFLHHFALVFSYFFWMLLFAKVMTDLVENARLNTVKWRRVISWLVVAVVLAKFLRRGVWEFYLTELFL